MKTPSSDWRQLLINAILEGNYASIDDLINSLEVSGDLDTWADILHDCIIDSKGRFYASTAMTFEARLQQYADYALLELICKAPTDLNVNETLRSESIRCLKLRDQPAMEDEQRKSWKFPSAVYQLSGLETLDLFGFSIDLLPDGISTLRRLNKLILARTGLTELPSDIGECRQLEILDLSLNGLTSIPNNLTGIRGLKALHLDGNSLRDLPDEFRRLKELKIIRLPENYFYHFPEVLTKMPALERINISYNKLSKPLPDSIANMLCLTEINLRGNNKFKYDPQGFHRSGTEGDAIYIKVGIKDGHPSNEVKAEQTEPQGEEIILGEKTSAQRTTDPDKRIIELADQLRNYWTSDEPDHAEAGITLIRTIDDTELYRYLLRDWSQRDGMLELKKSDNSDSSPPFITKASHLINLLKENDNTYLKENFDLSSVTYIKLDHASLLIEGIHELLPELNHLNVTLEGDPPKWALEGFRNVTTAFIGSESLISQLIIDGWPFLDEFEAMGRQLGSVIILNCESLRRITLFGRRTTNVRISDNPKLTDLIMDTRQKTALYIDGCPALSKLTQDGRGDFHPFHIGEISGLKLIQLGHSGNLALIERLFQSEQLIDICISERTGDPSQNRTITELPACRSRKIRSFQINHTGIKKIPDWIFEQRDLEYLHLSDNQISEIPADWSGFRSLESVALNSNELHSIPDNIDFPDTLKALRLTDNMLTNLPTCLARLPALERLDLGKQHEGESDTTVLRRIPPELSGRLGLKIYIRLEDIDQRKMIAEKLAWQLRMFGKIFEETQYRKY